MITIRSKLLIILWLVITALLLLTGYWNYLNTREQLLELINTKLTPETMTFLVENIVLVQSIPMLCLWFVLLLLTGLSIRWSLKPLEKISTDISLRHPDYLAPLNDKKIPLEIKPMIAQINHLFARLREAQVREKRFTADASHELRTPLAAAKIQAEVALATTDAQKREQALEKTILCVDRCTNLIQQLGILAKLKPHQEMNDVTEVNLTSVAAEVIAELVPLALDKSIDIQLDAEPNANIQGNFAYLRIMMRNIINNAICYSNSHETILVEISKAPRYILFRVEDHGPGIPAEMHERVFERFYRGLGHATSGSGLGLAIVDQIVVLHHASIQLGKPRVGKSGLCFDVVFPIIPTP
ncbi:MAG: ATP-binding protein [Gammaproteobacteria bacterium]